MTPHDIYLQARQHGLQIEATDDGQHLDIQPKGKCPPEFMDILRQHKPALIAWLRAGPCPGWGVIPLDDLPLVQTEPRPQAFRREIIIGYILRQPREPVYRWIVQRESAYFNGPGRRWDCASHAYAAARDLACWQTARSEADLVELLSNLTA